MRMSLRRSTTLSGPHHTDPAHGGKGGQNALLSQIGASGFGPPSCATYGQLACPLVYICTSDTTVPHRNGSTIQAVRAWRFIERLNNGDPVPYHGDCLAPRTVVVRGVASQLLTRLKAAIPEGFDMLDGEWLNLRDDAEWRRSAPSFDPAKQMSAYLSVRCRRCETCNAAKSKIWAHRAKAEMQVSRRTWFVTLTVHPGHRFNMQMRAQQRIREHLDKLDPDDQFRALVSQLGPHCGRWLKRLRKASGCRFRYLLVMEPHEDGFPHVHALLHEVEGSLTERGIRRAWWLSKISQAKLVDQFDKKVAWYVCKYIAKHPQTRIRASLRYGQVEDRLSELVSVLSNSLRAAKGASAMHEDPASGAGVLSLSSGENEVTN